MIRKLAIVLALLAGAGLLGTNFVRSGLYYEPMASMSQSAESPEAGREAAMNSAVGWGEEIVQHNLFDPDRAEPVKIVEKTPLVSAPQVEVKEKEQPKLELNGIILNQYGELVAYLAINGTAPRQARKGDTLDEMRVLDVTDKNVELMWDGKPISLTMEKIRTLKDKNDIANGTAPK